MITMELIQRFTWTLAFALFFSTSAFAQTGQITGVVTDSLSGDPLPGVNVLVRGTQQGASTNAEGNYTITGLEPGTYTLQASFVGYENEVQEGVEVTAGETTMVNFDLQQAQIGLDEVVVTGTAGQARRREVGNSISTIDVEDLVEVPISTDNLLAARAPGVTVQLTSGMSGGGAQIRLRGNASATLGNAPIIYIDGFRMQSGGLPTGADMISGTVLNHINPSNIERIEIIKGAAATTLYGTEAASGVIQIFTKDGYVGQPRVTARIDQSLGRVQPYGPENAPYMRAGPWLRTAHTQNYTVSVSGGGSDLRYYVSGLVEDGSGVLPNDSQRKYNVRGNFSLGLADNLQLRWNTFYTRSDISNPPTGNDGQALLLNAYRGAGNYFGEYDVEAISQTLDWRLFTNVDHLLTGVSAIYSPFSGFTNRVTIGYDRTVRGLRQYWPFGFALGQQGMVSDERWASEVLTAEYTGTIDWQISPDFSSELSLGGQSVTTETNNIFGFAENLAAPGEPTLGSGATTRSSGGRQRVINAGVFAQNLFSLRDRYFLTLGLRVDGNSSFGENFGLQPYPKASVSYVISDEPFWNADWGTLKLRGAYGHAGRAPGTFDAVRTWNAAGWGNNPALLPDDVGNPDLGPERTQETEVGFNGGFLDDRLQVDFSYYYQLTSDALMAVRQIPSLGFGGTQLDNVGTIRNRGLELDVQATLLQGSSFTWDAGFYLGTNFSKVLDLGEAESFSPGPRAIVQEGEPIIGVFGRRILNPDEIAEPEFYQDETTGTRYVFGPNLPTHTIGVNMSLQMPYGIRLSARGEYMGGHYIHVDVLRNMAIRGVLPMCEDIYPVIDGPGRSQLTARERAVCDLDYAQGTYSLFVLPGDFIKLRDVTLQVPVPFDLPQINSATFSASLENIRLWLNEDFMAFDPEMMQYGPTATVRQIVEDIPPPYRISAALRLRF